MTQTFDVSPVVQELTPPIPEIPLPDNVFFLLWKEGSTLVEVYRPDVAGPSFPPILLASDTLPLTMEKTENLGFYNTASQPRRTFTRQLGLNAFGISKTSFIISTLFSDSRDPGICVWDWERNSMFGPLVLPDPQRQMIGPIKIGSSFLYFISIKESDKLISLYRTLVSLDSPTGGGLGAELLNTATAAGPVLAPVEYMMATSTDIGVLYFPGELIPYQFGQVWSISDPSITDVVPVTGMDKYRIEDRFSQPGLVIAPETFGNGFIVKEEALGQSNHEVFISATSIGAADLVYPSAGDQKAMDDEIEIRFGSQNITIVRHWETGVESSRFTFPEPPVGGFDQAAGDRQ